jgi:hypothetical protein
MTRLSPGRFCSHGDRSWTDLYTNVTLFAEIDLLRHLRGVVSAGRYILPPRLAPAFIHEATHHWCFNTSVGLALTLLFLRTRRRAHAARSGLQSFSGHEICSDVAKVETAEECLRPLAEGLALFAEFDVTPRMISTPKVSFPLWWTNHFFSTTGRELVAHGLLEMLTTLRSSPEMERRRRGVLADECTGKGGGYLPGYLAVKQMWLTAVERDTRFIDRDLFMIFFKSLIFADMDLISILLDSETSVDVVAEKIVKRVERRLVSLWKLDLKSELDRFIIALESEGLDVSSSTSVIDCDAGVTARAQKLLRSHISEIELIPSGKVSEWDMLCYYDGLTLARRGLMRLGSVRATAAIRHCALSLEAGGEPLLAMAARPKARLSGSSNVLLDVEMSPASDYLIFSVWQDRRLLAQSVHEGFGKGRSGRKAKDHSQMSLNLDDREHQVTYYDRARDDVDLMCDPEGRQNLRADVREEFFDFLSEIALGQTPIPLRAPRWHEMANEGILALLHGDNDKLHVLSVLGLISSISTNKSIVLDDLAKLNITEAEVIAVSEAGESMGVPLVIVQGDFLITVT